MLKSKLLTIVVIVSLVFTNVFFTFSINVFDNELEDNSNQTKVEVEQKNDVEVKSVEEEIKNDDEKFNDLKKEVEENIKDIAEDITENITENIIENKEEKNIENEEYLESEDEVEKIKLNENVEENEAENGKLGDELIVEKLVEEKIEKEIEEEIIKEKTNEEEVNELEVDVKETNDEKDTKVITDDVEAQEENDTNKKIIEVDNEVQEKTTEIVEIVNDSKEKKDEATKVVSDDKKSEVDVENAKNEKVTLKETEEVEIEKITSDTVDVNDEAFESKNVDEINQNSNNEDDLTIKNKNEENVATDSKVSVVNEKIIATDSVAQEEKIEKVVNEDVVVENVATVSEVKVRVYWIKDIILNETGMGGSYNYEWDTFTVEKGKEFVAPENVTKNIKHSNCDQEYIFTGFTNVNQKSKYWIYADYAGGEKAIDNSFVVEEDMTIWATYEAKYTYISSMVLGVDGINDVTFKTTTIPNKAIKNVIVSKEEIKEVDSSYKKINNGEVYIAYSKDIKEGKPLKNIDLGEPLLSAKFEKLAFQN